MRYEILSSPEGVTVRKLNTGSFGAYGDAKTIPRTMPLEEALYLLIPFLTGTTVGLHVPAYEKQRKKNAAQTIRNAVEIIEGYKSTHLFPTVDEDTCIAELKAL